MFTIFMASAIGAAVCLVLALSFAFIPRLRAADRHELLTVASALALAMPLLVLAIPASLRVSLPIAGGVVLEESVARGTVDSARQGSPPSSVSAERPSARRAIDIETLVWAGWALGAVFCFARLARSARAAARIRRRARTWQSNVALSREVLVPIVTGVVRPSIVLPDDAVTWDNEDLELALLHERAHIARHDLLKQWLASLMCAFHWFNPLAWIAARRMAAEREHAVDAALVAEGVRGSSYAALLLRLATRADDGLASLHAPLHAPVHAPVVSRTELSKRVESILAAPRQRASRLVRASCAVAIALAALAVACSQGGASTSRSATSSPRQRDDGSTLDQAKQSAAEAMLDEWLAEEADTVRAHAIAIEVASGDVLVFAGRDRAVGRITGLEHDYPPASTIKPLVVAAALDAGMLSESEPIDGMSLAELLAVSSNVGATKVGERLGSERLVVMLDGAGLFDRIDHESVAPGVRPRAEGDAQYWATVSLGHNFSVNPLRVAAAYAALAADGTLVAPRFDRSAPSASKRFVSAATAHSVIRMLESAVSDEGTGKLARVESVRIAGKTGTADVGENMLYASFVGMLPADAPRYVVLVGAVTRTGNGGSIAAPRFARLVDRAFR